MLALDVQLLADFETLFIEKKAITIDKKIQNLIKHLHLPIVISTHQNQKYTDPRITKQGGSYFKIVNKRNDEELVQSTRLKLMLIDKFITSAPTFTTVNISGLSEKLQPKYGATYPNAADKNKAQAHIKALLSDAHWIKITDGYMANNDWNSNKALINTLIPHKKLDLTIVTNNFTQKSDLEAICNTWNVKTPQFPSNIHDRYIETDKVKILLSSGLFHLSSNSNKDFTYIIELK
ncbi:MAG: hypothetical protein WA080_00670 [Sulfuricurvum sp.]